MCGFVGIATYGQHIDESAVARMSALIAHRGPDQAGMVVSLETVPQVALATRRLAILDLSAEGAQPMYGSQGNLRLAYNGEVYNHQALRRELATSGHHYRSSSDTETIVHAWERWGPAALRRLSGMFALAMHDSRRHALTLARDARGIKPLYYTWDGQTLMFASELKSLLRAGFVAPKVDPTALWLYLCLGFVPSPYTIVAGVQKLAPGHMLELRNGQIQISRFAESLPTAHEAYAGRQAAAQIRSVVEGAVERQLLSDVPVGVFLSGGLDSSIIAALATQHHHAPLHTFAVGYAPASGERYNEDMRFARLIAGQLGTHHHEVVIEDTLLDNVFADLIFQLDEPMVEPVFVSTYFLAELARKNGVPVVLTGDGADELFGGYDRYFAARRLNFYRGLPGLRAALPLLNLLGNRSIGRNVRELHYLLGQPSATAAYIRFSSIYHPEQALSLLRPALQAQVQVTALDTLVAAALGAPGPFEDQMARADLNLWVGEHFNPRLDRISMRHSIEARVPFQDDAVVAAALAIPLARKSTALMRKGLLRRAFADLIPPEVAARPKRSYQAPGSLWLSGGLRRSYEQLCAEGGAIDDLCDPVTMRHYAGTLGTETPGGTFATLALLTLDLWLRQYTHQHNHQFRTVGA